MAKVLFDSGIMRIENRRERFQIAQTARGYRLSIDSLYDKPRLTFYYRDSVRLPEIATWESGFYARRYLLELCSDDNYRSLDYPIFD